MEVCRLCLDLLYDNSFLHLEGSYKDMTLMVVPEMNLEISANPVVCKECSNCLRELYKFKSSCFENEEQIRQKSNSKLNSKLSLKEILQGSSSGEIVMSEKAKERMCRMCLDSIECESFTVLKPSKPDAYLDSMLTMCLPELDLELSTDPVMCEKCLNNLQKLHHLKSTCLDVEEKLNNYCLSRGTNSSSQINLHSVLQSFLNNKAQNAEFVAVKTEKMDDENIEIKEKDKIKTENAIKDEEIEIKSEESGGNDKKNIKPPSKSREVAGKLLAHRKLEANVVDDRSLKCEVCNNHCSDLSNLRFHKKTHDVIKPFACPLCSKAFTKNRNMKRHYRLHFLEKPFVCDVCRAAKRHLEGERSVYEIHHRSSHSVVKSYECVHCSGRFTFKSDLLRHIRGHMGENPYQCDICPAKFTRDSALMSHREAHTQLF